MTPSDPHPVVAALMKQVDCYRNLAKLAELQRVHVQQGASEDLLNVLRQRQGVLDKAVQFEQTIGPAKRAWPMFLASLEGTERSRAETLLAETRRLLGQITAADRTDVMVLQQRKINLGRQIRQTGAARTINRKYALSAYGKRPPRMDVQR